MFPYTPQQNGIVERKNRILVEMERSMMQRKKLSNVYLNEVVIIVMHILNRSPTWSLYKITPYEVWFERKTNLQYL